MIEPNYFLTTKENHKIAVYDNQKTDVPAILFIHGNSLGGSAFENQFADPTLNQYRLIAFDLLGHGKSDNAADPATGYSVSSLIDSVNFVCTQLNLSKTIVAGYSFGAHLVMQNKNAPSMFDGAFLYGYPPLSALSDLSICGFQNPAQALWFTEELSEDDISTMIREFEIDDPQQVKLFYSLIKRSDGKFRFNVMASVASGLANNEIDTIESFRNPVALVHFVNDRFIRHDYIVSKNIKNLWRGAVHQTKGGHSGFATEPGDFNRLLSEYCKEVFGVSE